MHTENKTFTLYYPISEPVVCFTLNGIHVRQRIPLYVFRWFENRKFQCGSYNLERNLVDILEFGVNV